MPLIGVNPKCCKCLKECKQWRQVTVVQCPNFVGLKASAKHEKRVNIIQETLPVVPSKPLNTADSTWIRSGVQ